MSALQPVKRDYFITMANYTRWSQKLTIASGCNELYLCVYIYYLDLVSAGVWQRSKRGAW